MRQTTLLILLFLVSVPYIQSKATFDYACDPRNAQLSCLLGCLGCLESYGRDMYNMASCCQDCRETGAEKIDDGPAQCSNKYIKSAWIARFGK
ncbi:hypothetical protein ScPMuIL_014216 [Solemya velum]